MKTLAAIRPLSLLLLILSLILLPAAHAQLLLNVDFGVGMASPKTGLAATGLGTNDFWNIYSHYSPRHLPGKAYQTNGFLDKLKLSDRTETAVSLGVTNAPGTWGNSSGDAMFDHFIFPHNGSNISLTLRGLEPGSYQFYLYGHADADSGPEQNSLFQLRSGTNVLGPLGPGSAPGWKVSQGWQEGRQFIVFRDVPVLAGEPVVITVLPGPGGVAVLNGLQILSRGTSPPKVFAQPAPVAPATYTNLIVREVRYDGKVTDSEARFTATVEVESLTTNEVSAILFEGDIAVFAPDLPAGVRLTREAAERLLIGKLVSASPRAGVYRLHCAKPGVHTLKLEVIARITKAEPWNHISFTGPPAATASLKAEGNTGVEVELLSGALIEGGPAKAASALAGVVGADRVVSLRWQSKTTEIARKSLITVDTAAAAQVSPTVIKFTTQLRYELLQASAAKLSVALPAGHTLTRVQGDGIRDWRIAPAPERGPVPGGGQAEPYFILTVEFAKPVEKAYALTLFTELPVESTPVTMNLRVPQPLDIERESGTFTVGADDTVVEVDGAPGLRQVNASTGTLFAWRFNARPFSVAARLKRIEPVLETAARLTARLEESRLVVSHAINLSVLKAGIYAAEFSYPTNFNVTDVRGANVEDWKATAGKLKVNYTQRVLGTHRLDVTLEQPHKTFPAQITIAPVRLAGATKETAFIGAASAAGIRLKTETLTNSREIPVAQLSGAGVPPAFVLRASSPADSATGTVAGHEAAGTAAPLLAFTADAPDWKLALATERLPARVVAEVFNLVTVGDGLVGGSATIRFGILNQGVQEFKVRLPAHWKNVEFTGPNIRRKEQATNLWTISLQDKAWGGYTLVVTYDYQFDPKKAALDLAGAHCDGVERETGSLAVTVAANLKLQPKPAAEPLRAIDPSELAETDRALCTRPVLLAWRYTGGDFALAADAARFDEVRLLDAVADRTQLTSVVTEAGEMLTQASFMVKNNDKQFQRFGLPPGATLWGCYVNNEPSKVERDGEWLVVPLPRGANRDEAFAVDLVYQQKLAALTGWLPQTVQLQAPTNDVPNTYAEWQLFVPATKRVSSFGGTMTVARGTTYGLREAWERALNYFENFGNDWLVALLVMAVAYGIAYSIRKNGMKGVGTAAAALVVIAIVASMMLPALSKAKAKSARIKSANNLKQIGLAARVFANDNADRFPDSFEEMPNELGSDKILTDPESGERYVWVGAGKPEHPDAILSYSPVENNGRNVVFADGRVEQLNGQGFYAAQQKDAQIVAQSAVRRAQGVGMAQDTRAKARLSGDFTSFNGEARNRLSRLNADGAVDSTFNPQQANKPAEPEMANRELERLAEVDKKQAQREMSESLARDERGGRVVEVTKKWNESTRAGMDRLDVARKAAASGPMPATPPPVALTAPALPPTDPQGKPTATSGVFSFGAAQYSVAEMPTNSSVTIQRQNGSGGVVAVDFDTTEGLAASQNRFQLGALAVGGMGGVGGGGAPGRGSDFVTTTGEAAQTAAGMRSIRIDIPRSGQAFTFTKVLNLRQEPLGIELSLMPLGKFRAAQSAGQLALFVGGLLWALLCWRSAERSSFGITLGLALALAGVTWLGLSARTLHWVLIGAVPLVGGALLLWAAWRCWPRSHESYTTHTSSTTHEPAPAPQPPTDTSGPVPPAAALLMLGLLTASTSAQPAATPHSSLLTPHSSLLTPHSSLLTPHAVTLTSATYTGTLREKSAEFTATLALSSTGTNQTFSLFGGDVAIQSFTAKSGEARLVREGATARVWLPKAGAVTVELKLLARLEGDVTKRRLAFGLPPALASQFTAVIEEADADVEFPSAVAFKRTPAGKQTRVEAIIGSTDRVDLAWTPRLKRIAEMDATIFAQTATLVTVGGGVVNSRAFVDYQIAQGELRQAKVRLPAGQRLLRVEGEGIRTWELMTEAGTEVLSVDLLKGVTASWRLTIETEKSLGALPATVKVEVPIVQDVRRESGLVAVRGAEETSLSIETATDLQRVDLAEFNRATKANATDLVSAFRYLRSAFAFAVKAEAVQPQIDATVMQRLRVGAEELRLAAEVTYNVKKAGIFQLRAQIPVGWRIETVGSVDAALRARGSAFGLVNNWTEKTDAGVRVLEVPLRERTQGAVSLLVILVQTLKEAPKSLAVPAVHPLGVDKLNGFVAVSTEAGLSVKTESFDGLSEIPAATMPVGIYKGLSEQATLAFKFLATEPSATATWRLGLAAEQLESWVRAEVVNLISVSETLVSGRALVRLDIANAPVKEFRLKIPLTVTNVDITGGNIRRRDQTGEVWRVELQNKLRGQHTFMVTWEQARAAKTNAPVDVPAVEAVGVERETGSVAILAKPPLQVSEKAKSGELLTVDPRELPEWAAAYASGAKGEQVVLAWRYLRPGWKLAVTPQRFAEAAVLQALVDSARLTTVVADDGQMMTEVSLSVRNNGRQFLEVELPPGAMVWSAFVAGTPVRPTKQGGKLLLPLEQNARDAAMAVEFTYVAADKFPKRKGSVAFASPKLDVPLKNARWELLLPPDYEYTDFAGTMGRDLSGAPVVTVNYSATEYSRQEARSKELRDNESKTSLGRLSGMLSSGNLSAANNEFFNYKRSANPQGNRGGQGGQSGKDMDGDDYRQLKEVEVQLRRSQASNLVQAQQAYTLDNATKLGLNADSYFARSGEAKEAQAQAPQQVLLYDTDAAEQQLDKLQKAQEVTVTTVQPLRVNLPLRGQRHAFTQVLQTEVNKPMTVEFTARNQKTGGWLKPIALTFAAFLALWIAVAVFAERRQA